MRQNTYYLNKYYGAVSKVNDSLYHTLSTESCRFSSHRCCFGIAIRDDSFDRSAFYVLFKKFWKSDTTLHFRI